MPNAAENERLTRELYKAFFSGDLERWFSYVDDESVLIEVDGLPYGGTYKGVAEFRRAITVITEIWADIKFDIVEIMSSDLCAMGYGIFSVTSKKTGRRISFPLAEKWTFVGGKIRELRPYYADTVLVRSALV